MSGVATKMKRKHVPRQGCHASGKSQGNLNFFKVMALSGNFANCQVNLEWLVNVRELSGNFENT